MSFDSFGMYFWWIMGLVMWWVLRKFALGGTWRVSVVLVSLMLWPASSWGQPITGYPQRTYAILNMGINGEWSAGTHPWDLPASGVTPAFDLQAFPELGYYFGIGTIKGIDGQFHYLAVTVWYNPRVCDVTYLGQRVRLYDNNVGIGTAGYQFTRTVVPSSGDDNYSPKLGVGSMVWTSGLNEIYGMKVFQEMPPVSDLRPAAEERESKNWVEYAGEVIKGTGPEESKKGLVDKALDLKNSLDEDPNATFLQSPALSISTNPAADALAVLTSFGINYRPNVSSSLQLLGSGNILPGETKIDGLITLAFQKMEQAKTDYAGIRAWVRTLVTTMFCIYFALSWWGELMWALGIRKDQGPRDPLVVG